MTPRFIELKMADCLSLLRQYNVQKKEIIERDNLIIFDQLAWPKHVKTNYLVFRGAKESGPKDYYTLESLLFLLKNVTLSHPLYIQRANTQKIPSVKLPDRKALLAYLNGETDTSTSIDKSVPLEMAITTPAPKRHHDDAPDAIKKAKLESKQLLEEKQRLAAKLSAPKEGGAITDQIRSLSEAMSVEKIAAIKAKRLAKKRQTIKMDNDPNADQRLFMESDLTRDIIKKERHHKTRTNVLLSTGKTFDNIMELLKSVKAREEGQAGVNTATTDVQKQPKQDVRQAVTHGYNRYDQEKFRGKEEMEDFKIDTMGTYHGLTLKSVTEGVATKQQTHDHLVKQPVTNSTPVAKQQQVQSPVKESRVPIIIVPSVTSSVITVYNVVDFLQDYKYVSVEEKKSNGKKKETEVLLQRRKSDQNGQTVTVPYQILDNPQRLTPSDWKRVVAVFVAGPSWQFKGWPWIVKGGSPADIFTKIKGFHLKFTGFKLEANIQTWDVQVLEISSTKRHLDKASVLKFWDTLDKFMIKNCSHLRF